MGLIFTMDIGQTKCYSGMEDNARKCNCTCMPDLLDNIHERPHTHPEKLVTCTMDKQACTCAWKYRCKYLLGLLDNLHGQTTCSSRQEKLVAKDASLLVGTDASFPAVGQEQSETREPAGGGITLQVCGTGQVEVTLPTQRLEPAPPGQHHSSPAPPGQHHPPSVISVAVNAPTPVILTLPGTKEFQGVRVQCQGSVELLLGTKGSLHDKPLPVTTPTAPGPDTGEHTPCNTSKTHRRTSSAYLLVTGAMNHLVRKVLP